MSYELKGKEPKTILVGNRIPRHFFLTSGTGESPNHHHTGSYHHALGEAGIARCNIMKYSSILPKIATEVEKTPELLESLVHGSVMDIIEAKSEVGKGERATAGIIWGWLYDRETGQKYGGIVCERDGKNIDEKTIEEQLRASINELYERWYSEKFKLKNVTPKTISFISRDDCGTALVALCFFDYEVPILE